MILLLLIKLAVVKLNFGQNLIQYTKINSALIFSIILTQLLLVFSKEAILFFIYLLADKANSKFQEKMLILGLLRQTVHMTL